MEVAVGDQDAHWFNLGVCVKRYLILVVDVIELFLGDLDSSARDEYHLDISTACNLGFAGTHFTLIKLIVEFVDLLIESCCSDLSLLHQS